MSKKQILIVEDESSMAKQLKWGLADTYDLSVATNAPEALDLIRKSPPTAVLLDLGLPPDQDGATEGINLIKQIVRMPHNIKIIVITVNTHKDVAAQTIRLGAYDYHQKPVNIGNQDRSEAGLLSQSRAAVPAPARHERKLKPME